MHVKYPVVPAALMLFALVGCGDDRPSDKVASAAILQQAQSDVLDGLEIVEFERSNGQVDPDSANRYRVTYTYKLQLTKPYGEAILATAEDLHEELERAAQASQSAASVLDLGALEQAMGQMQYTLTASQWLSAQGDQFPARREALLDSCAPCKGYWNGAQVEEQAELRRLAFIIAWSHFEGLSFKDDAKVGDAVERYAWRNFEKTEKGWFPSAL